MAGSSAEKEIRDALVSWFHENEPTGRIVHEINVAGQGSNRADLGVVFSDTLVLVEIKSERDTLTRLEKQFDAFYQCCHRVIVVAHQKHFNEQGDLSGSDWMRWSHKEHIWRYPAPASGWDLKRYAFGPEPHALHFLEMLWADELWAEIERYGVASPSGSARWAMIRDLTLGLTGKQIREAVCRQLRKRRFAEADDPIVERLAV